MGKHESLFPIIVFLAPQILGIVGSQIDIKRIFSLVGILTNLRRLIFVSKNWPNVPRMGFIGLLT